MSLVLSVCLYPLNLCEVPEVLRLAVIVVRCVCLWFCPIYLMSAIFFLESLCLLDLDLLDLALLPSDELMDVINVAT